MELADLRLTVFLVGCPVGLMVAFIWKIYRRGIWGAIEIDPQLLQRVHRAWKRRSGQRGPR